MRNIQDNGVVERRMSTEKSIQRTSRSGESGPAHKLIYLLVVHAFSPFGTLAARDQNPYIPQTKVEFGRSLPFVTPFGESFGAVAVGIPPMSVPMPSAALVAA